jgi:hypothetical protein
MRGRGSWWWRGWLAILLPIALKERSRLLGTCFFLRSVVFFRFTIGGYGRDGGFIVAVIARY